jgi:hypothetical protein
VATAHEIRELIAQTNTGTHRRHVPREVREQIRRYVERRRAKGATWQAIARETALEARKLRTWCQKPLPTGSPPVLRPVEVVEKPKASRDLVLVWGPMPQQHSGPKNRAKIRPKIDLENCFCH